MSPSQTIVWVALPNGFTSRDGSRRARLSVFVSPQLQPDESSALFPFDFVNWPSRLESGDVHFEVAFENASAPAEMVSRPDPRLWNAIYHVGTFVRPHELDASSSVFGTYPAARLHDLLKSGYQQAGGESPVGSLRAMPRTFAELQQLFAPTPGERDVDGLGLSERDRRVLLGRQLLRPGSAEEVAGRLNRLVDLARLESAQMEAAHGTSEFVPIVPDTGSAAETLAQFIVFHRQPAGTKGTKQRRDIADNRIDFHQRLTNMGEYPALLRLLGLIIDLEINPNDIPEPAAGTHGLVRVIPHFATASTVAGTSLTPPTAYVFDHEERFAAASSLWRGDTDEVISGLLNLRLPVIEGSLEGRFHILQMDIDGAAFRILDLLSGTRQLSLPSLRSGGVSITQHGNAHFLHDALKTGLQKMAALSAGEPVTLFAEDLIRGIRVDVQDSTSGEWRSLHRREGTYKVPGLESDLQLEDEGFIQAGLVQPSPSGPEPGPSTHDAEAPNYVSESLFLWQGWSLAAPRPGEPLEEPPSSPATSPPADEFELEVSFKPAKRSLPRLRFGERYALRVRMVDLAGNGLSLDEADETLAALEGKGFKTPVLPPPGEDFRFLRFEPVPSPLVAPRANPRDGETVERVVIRSDRVLTPEAFVAAHPKYALGGERHIAPPKTTQLFAEMFGFFDSSIGTERGHEGTHTLAAREERAIRDDGVHPEAAMAVSYLPDPLAAGASFSNLPGAPDGTIGRVVGNRLEFSEAALSPDVFGDVRSVVAIDFGSASAWPHLSSFRVRLAEGDRPPTWDASARVLSVFLAKGESRTVRLSCNLRDDSALRLLAIWDWVAEWLREQVQSGQLSEAERSARIDELRELSLLGLSTLLTPYRELTLVHAVQQPLKRPVFASFATERVANGTFAYMRGQVQVHPSSTGSIELIARWTDPVDDPQQPERLTEAPVLASPLILSDPTDPAVEISGPNLTSLDAAGFAAEDELRNAYARLDAAAFTAGLGHGSMAGLDPNVPLNEAAREPIAERWHGWRTVGESLEAAANAHLADLNPPDLPPGSPRLPDHLRLPIMELAGAAGALRLRAAEALAELNRFERRHEFGDTKHRVVRYQVVATTRFGECFSRQSSDEDLEVTQTSEEVTVDVPSSSSPAPPGVQYIVPAFAWQRTRDEETSESHRRGGALRVYLERPWYSSGDGELLGVALGPTATAPTRRIEPYVTQWGRDPLWASPPISPTETMLAPGDFRNAVTEKSCNLQERTFPFSVRVVGFPVEFDPQGRCFCDIELNPRDVYYPFVRLAVVRFQPNSIPGVEISRVVLADFAQLAPDRAVAVVRRAADVFAVTVTGRTHQSPTDPTTPGAALGTRVRLSMQERIPGTTDDAGWLPAGDRAIVTPESAVPSGEVLWSGTVSVPGERNPGQFRLLIEELETYRRLDAPSFSPTFINLDRVVFAETVAI